MPRTMSLNYVFELNSMPMHNRLLGVDIKMSKGSKISFWLGLTCVAIYAFMLVFRAIIYPGMYIAPDDPYGLSDIVELFLGLIVVVLMISSVITSLILFIRGNLQSKKSALALLLLCIAIYFSYSPLHRFASSWVL